jgi:bifunctional non-homologous end joining protein LigD
VSARRSGGPVEIELDGRRIRLKNLDKVFYPSAGFTKGEVIEYYARVAPALLPHLEDRPLTLKRYPEGVDGPFFYEKRCPRHRPDWFRTEPVWSEGSRAFIHYCVVDDLASLVWLASMANLELHTALACAQRVDAPTVLVFDLDPGAPADLLDCCDVALLLRRLMRGLGLECLAKTSGSKGMQVYVPLNGEDAYDETKTFAHAVARLLEARHPGRVVERMTKSLRSGKVLVDWSQNDRNKTTVCAYSLRAMPRPTASTPLRWTEVERAARTRRSDGLVFEARDVLARLDRYGDLFEPVLSLRQRLPSAERLDEVPAR